MFSLAQISQGFQPDFRWAGVALQALQEASESNAVKLLEDTNECAIHRKVSLLPGI